MRRTLQLAAAFFLIAGAVATRAQIHLKQDKPQAEDLQWLWQYTKPAPGSRENQMLLDPRFKTFLESHLTAPQSFWNKNQSLSEVAMEFLGVPGDVIGDDNRYFNANGCVPHFCPDRGLLWADLGTTHPLIVFAAINWISDNKTTDESGATYTMWVFSNRVLDPNHPPAALIRSVNRWTSRPSSGSTELQNVTRVFFVDSDGTTHPVTPSAIGAHNNLPAETASQPRQEEPAKAQHP
jgi:hypothetical protein